jgi:uncharacterized membrane protein
MSDLEYVVVGPNANDGLGDSLRDAFIKINYNFSEIAAGNANITLPNAPVQSVAGRYGNVVLTVNDVAGAASIPYVNSLLGGQNTVTQLYNTVQGLISDVAGANAAVASTQSTISSLQSGLAATNANVSYIQNNYSTIAYVNQAVQSQIASTGGYSNVNVAAYIGTTLSSINANIVALQGTVFSFQNVFNNELTTANTAMMQYVNDQISSTISTLNTDLANVAGIAANIATINSFLQTTNIESLLGNAGSQQTQINAINANVAAANAAIVTANVAMKSYVDGITSQLNNSVSGNITNQINNLGSELAANVTLLQSEINNLGNALVANVISLNSNLTTANNAVVSYVNDQITSVTSAWTANAASQELEIQSLNANLLVANTTMANYVNDQISNTITTLNTDLANVAGVAANIATINSFLSNVNIESLFANSAIQELEIQQLQANVYANANAAAYLTVYGGDVLANTLTANNVSAANTFQLPVGNTSDRPITTAGSVRFNNDINSVEYFDGTEWVPTTAIMTEQTFNGDGINSAYTLNRSATTVSILVSINGTIQEPNTAYMVDSGQIMFAEVLQPYDTVSIRYLGSLTAVDIVGNDIPYIMGNYQNWNGNVTTISSALDQIAARLKAAGF